MKSKLKLQLAAAGLMAGSLLAACGNNNSNNASYAADTANKAAITKKDTANKNAIAKADTSDKEAMKKADSTNKAVTEIKEDASKFLVKSFESGMFEIEASQLAATHSTNADVKSFAAKVITAHKGFNTSMAKIALDANYKLPGGIDSDHANELSKLDGLKGADFDKKYMDAMVSGHQKSVDNYTKAYKDLATGITKEYTGKTLPMIQQHLAMAKMLKDKVK